MPTQNSQEPSLEPYKIMRPVLAVVLAAGSSERLGQPKALVPITVDGEEIPLIRWLVERLEDVGVETSVVTRQELVVDILTALPGRGIVINPNPEAGRTGSLQCGIRALLDVERKGRDFRLLVVPVDRPGFSDATLSALLDSPHCACPAQDGRGGHPLLLTGEDVHRIMYADRDRPLRELVNPMRINVVDEHLHLNLDTEADLQLLAAMVADI